MTFAQTGPLGSNFDRRTDDAEFALGTQALGNDSKTWVYVQANGAIAASQTDITVSAANQASDGSGTFVNTIAFADNEYGWVASPVDLHDAT